MATWEIENAVAGAVAGLTTVVALHPLDVVRTRFQVHDGREAVVPRYRGTGHALYTIMRTEGLKGLYAGAMPGILGSSISWGFYFFLYSNIKSWNQRMTGKDPTAGLHMISAAEAGSLVCLVTNPIWLVKTRLQLQAPVLSGHKPYLGFTDALYNIVKNEGWKALYKGLGPSLLLVSHGSLQFMAYEEGRKLVNNIRAENVHHLKDHGEEFLKPVDFAILGAFSKVVATSVTYPYQVVRARIQQRPDTSGVSKYASSWHAFQETWRFEGVRGLYKGMVPNLLKNVPASSLTFLVYEAVLRILKR